MNVLSDMYSIYTDISVPKSKMKGRSSNFSPFDMQLMIDDGDLMQDDAQMMRDDGKMFTDG